MSNIKVDYDILNQKQTPAFYASSLATRPAFGFPGRIFIDTDTPSSGIYRDTGSAWVQVADPGAGTTGTLQQVTTNGNTTTLGIQVQGIDINDGAGTGINNIAIGNGVLNVNTTGNSNTAIGVGTLSVNTTGANNTAIGYQSLNANTTGSTNTAVGTSALASNTTAGQNTAIGNSALTTNTTGATNTAIGQGSMQLNTTGASNTAIGVSSLYNNTTGTSNVAIGSSALTSNTTGSNNISIGSSSGALITTGSYNTIIGNYAGTTTLANNIVLSDGAGNVRLFSDANGLIGINQAVGSVPGGQLDIHSTQTYALVLNGLSTSNAYTAFSNNSVGKWRIGNTYNAGANSFDIYNLGTSSNALSFNSTTNAATFTGTIANGITQATITANASADFSTTFTPTTTITDINSYGLISRYKLNLANGVYNSSGTTNATAIFGFVNIDGNNGTVSTQSIRAITTGLAIATVSIKLSDYRNYQVNTPEALISGSTITNVFGLYINNQKGASNLTITNGWGIYQNGSSDNNYFNGSLFVGSNANNGYKLEVTGTAKVTSELTVERIQINSTTFQPLQVNSTYGQVGMNFGNSGNYFGGVGSANNFTSDPGILGTDLGMGTNGSATGKIAFSTGAGYSVRFLIKSNGILNATSVPTYADNTTAIAAGLVAGDFYRTAIGQLQIVF